VKILVLGSAETSGGTAAPASEAQPRTRSGLAVAATDGHRWVLINASPDIGEQLRERPELSADLAAAPARPVILTSAEIDTTAGLLSLRDGAPLELYATPSVFEDLTGALPLVAVLQHYCGVRWHLLAVAGEQRRHAFAIAGLEPLRFEALAMPGRAPRYTERGLDPAAGDHIALRITDQSTGQQLVYAPGFERVGPEEFEHLHDADCLLVDGSGWLARAPQRPPLSDLLARSRAARKVLLHLDGDHPLLDERHPERAALAAGGIEVAFDGMEIVL